MAGVITLDANVLIALLDATDVHHDWAVQFFLDHADAELSVSSLTFAEFLVYPTRAGTVTGVLTTLSTLQLDVEPLSELDAVPLAQLRASTRLKMPDAVVMHTARTRGGMLATTDAALTRAARDLGVPTLAPTSGN